MEILLDRSQEELNKLNTLQKAHFLPMTTSGSENNSEGVAAVIESKNFVNELDKAITLDLPVVVIAGLMNEQGEQYAEKALAYGISPECIIFKRENRVFAKSGKEFAADAKRGISVNVLVDICDYAYKHKLYPEVLIWEEPKNEAAPKSQPVKQKTPEKANTCPSITPDNSGKISVIKRDLAEVIDLAEYVIAVFKTTDNTRSSKFAADLSHSLNGLHLEINKRPISHVEYGLGVNEAVSGCQYAYSNGKTVDINSMYSGVKYLIVEMAPSLMESIELIYKKALKVIQVTPLTKDGIEAIRSWQKGKFALNSIIPEDVAGYSKLQNEFGDLVLLDAAAFIEKEIQ